MCLTPCQLVGALVTRLRCCPYTQHTAQQNHSMLAYLLQELLLVAGSCWALCMLQLQQAQPAAGRTSSYTRLFSGSFNTS